jgi:hypothetical protein
MGLFGKKKVNGFETYGSKEDFKGSVFEAHDKAEKSKKLKADLKKVGSNMGSNLKSIGSGVMKVANYIVPPKTPEQIAHEQKLRADTQKAQKDAYLKESIRQSKLKGKAMAKKKYAPQSAPINPLESIMGVGVPQSSKKQNLKKKIKEDNAFDMIMRM